MPYPLLTLKCNLKPEQGLYMLKWLYSAKLILDFNIKKTWVLLITLLFKCNSVKNGFNFQTPLPLMVSLETWSSSLHHRQLCLCYSTDVYLSFLRLPAAQT